MKPPPPPYPRPIPKIDLDEAPFFIGTIVCADELNTTQSDSQATDSERALKRRRIESAAEAYLRGEDLLIISASLRGPFDQIWQNPWKKRATAYRPVLSNTREHNVVTDPKKPLARGSSAFNLSPAVRRSSLGRTRRRSPPIHKDQNSIRGEIATEEHQDGNEEAGTWLHNSVDAQHRLGRTITSPTPVTRRKDLNTSEQSKKTRQPESQTMASAMDRLPKEKRTTSERGTTSAHCRLQRALGRGTSPKRDDNSSMESRTHHAAFSDIQRQTEAREYRGSKAADFKGIKSHEERLGRAERVTETVPDCEQYPADPIIPPLHTSLEIAPASTFSYVLASNKIPSAQKRPDMAPSESVLIDDKPIPVSTNESEHLLDNTHTKDSPKASRGVPESFDLNRPRSDAASLDRFDSDTVSAKWHTAASSPVDIQKLPAKTATSTSKLFGQIETNNSLDSQARSVKPRASWPKKKASFAKESESSPSIKDSLKVSKGIVSAHKGVMNALGDDVMAGNKLDSDQENHEYVGFPKNGKSRSSATGVQKTLDSAPRGILKNSRSSQTYKDPAADSVRGSKSLEKSSNFMPEGQGHQRMRMITGEDEMAVTSAGDELFDLNDAIDDLGSFLCSWDGGKEVH